MGQQLEYLLLAILNGALLFVLIKFVCFLLSKKD